MFHGHSKSSDDDENDSPDEANSQLRDLGSELLSILPGQEYSIHHKTLQLSFADKRPGSSQTSPLLINLIVDALPGCGGIVWPAGQVPLTSLAPAASLNIAKRSLLVI